MNVVSLPQMLLIAVLGCILYRIVMGIWTLLSTRKSQTASGASKKQKPNSGLVKEKQVAMKLRRDSSVVALLPFWYKATGMTPNAAPFSTEGSVKAASAAEALSIVQNSSTQWNARSLRNISIYKVSDHGVLSLDPEICTYEMGEQKLLPQQEKKETSPDVRSLTEEYDDARWTLPADADPLDNYPIVKLKEIAT
jgi:hypothetical protein